MTLVLGIDPGLADCGYGLVAEESGRYRTLDFGSLKIRMGRPPAERFLELFDKVSDLMARHRPAAVSLETLFFNKNSKTAFLVGRSTGVIFLAAARSRIPVFEYTPPQVKLALTGWGKADKTQIQKMIQVLLALKAPVKSDDAADALALAVCHLQHAKFKEKVGQIS